MLRCHEEIKVRFSRPRKALVKQPLRTAFSRLLVFSLFVFCGAGAAAQTAPKILKRDDLLFRKEMYTDKKGAKMPYRLYVPQDYDATKKYPLIFWFHGGEGRGFDNERQITGANELGTHLWTTRENQAQFPAFVLAPQCPSESNWGDPDLNDVNPQLQMALDILAIVQKKYLIDPDRIYLVGQSMGGLGAWALLQTFPQKWAAALILCSFDNFSNAPGIARVPLWIFQGDADLTVPLNLVQAMVKQLKKAGGQPRYFEYHKVGHEVWEKAFAEPDVVSWLSEQKRTN
jgi:predicted peptidase